MGNMSYFVAITLIAMLLMLSTDFDKTREVKNYPIRYVYTDNDTGCQYVAYTRGDLTPRMNKDGKQVCDAK